MLNRVFNDSESERNNATDVEAWTKEAAIKLLIPIDEICTSTTSLSSLHDSKSMYTLGLLEAWTFLKNYNVTLRDDPNNPLFSKKILPFLTAVCLQTQQMHNII